jgi:hypothetical protein
MSIKYIKIKSHITLRAVDVELEFCTFRFGCTPRTSFSMRLPIETLPVIEAIFIGDNYDNIIQKYQNAFFDVEHLISELRVNNLLEAEIPYETSRYSRNSLYYDLVYGYGNQVQERLLKATVCLIGAGGIGSWVSYNLACLGLKKIILVDGDLVEESNLSRQILYSERSIGLSKVDQAKARLIEFNSKIEVQTHHSFISSFHDLEKYSEGADLIVLSADYPQGFIQDWGMQLVEKNGIACINVGYFDGCGAIWRLAAHNSEICSDQRSEANTDISRSFKKLNGDCYRPPSFTMLNSITAAVGAMEVFKILCNDSAKMVHGDMIKIDINTMEIVRENHIGSIANLVVK